MKKLSHYIIAIGVKLK